MRKMTILLLVCCLLLGGCGSPGVSQEEYNAISEQLNSANDKVSELAGQNQAIQDEYDKVTEQLDAAKGQISDLASQNATLRGEYDRYKKEMKQYEGVFQYADEIKDYGNLKSEIEKMQEEKTQMETDIQKLQAQWKEIEEKIEAAKNPKPTSNTLVYSDKKVEIYFLEVTSKGVVFEVKNLTDVNVTIQADSVAINGISTNSIIMSDDVAPQSIGKVIAKCSDFSTSEKVYTVSGQLSIIDFSRSWKAYDAKFINVEIK